MDKDQATTTKKWRFFITGGGAIIKFKVYQTETERAYVWQSNQRPHALNVEVVPADYQGNPLMKMDHDPVAKTFPVNLDFFKKQPTT